MDSDKRARILTAAARVFGRRGYKKAPIDEIAAEAGVAKGTVYLAVRSKAELYEQAMGLELEAWLHDNRPPERDDVPLARLLEAQLTDEVASVEGYPLVTWLLTGEFRRVLPERRESLEVLRRRARENLLDLLRRGARAGRLRRDLDLEEVAVLLQDLEAATLLFHNRGDALEDAHFHRWDTAVSALVEGLDASREAALDY